MKNLYQKKIKKRTIILTFFLALWLCVLISRLIQFQVINYPRFRKEVIEQNQNKKIINPKRGTIYDRSGIILAQSLPVQSIFYSPVDDQPMDIQLEKINKLRQILHFSNKHAQTIKTRIEKNDHFIWIKRKIDLATAEKVKNLHLNGVQFIEENKRFYPQQKLAAHIIGRVSIDEEGQSGIEYKYNSTLQGKKGQGIVLRDAKRRGYRFQTLKEPQPGMDLVLTIDETIQYIAEEELQKAIHRTKASWGTVVISQPFSGEILAMANYPIFSHDSPRLDRNGAIHHTYAPGSTFKIITASAAIESGRVNFKDQYDCSMGFISIAGQRIRDHKKYETLSFPEVIIHSSNVGTIQVGQQIGEENLYKTITVFGFGQRTGIDLPAEEKGIFRSINDWTKISVASLSIGYEISVTAIQMLQAVNVIANKGVITRPKIVKKILDPSIEAKKSPLQFKRVISEETATRLTSIFREVTKTGTGKEAQVKGYDVAGKTGTAQKFDPSTGHYSSRAHTASFAGFAPAEKPVISMIIVIDDPQGQYYGGQVAAPVFREIAAQVLRYLHIPPQKSLSEHIITAKYWRQDKK